MEDLVEKAHLESKLDYLETELTYLNQILRKVGFTEGIETLKETIEVMVSENDCIFEA